STWTVTRDSALGLDFTGVTYYDGQGFMVPKKLGVKSAKQLDGASICVLTGSTSELNIADYFRANKITFKPVLFEDPDQSRQAFFDGRCDARPASMPRARPTRPSRKTTPSCPRSAPRSRGDRWCATATTSSPTSSAGCSTPCSRPRSTASIPRTSMRC